MVSGSQRPVLIQVLRYCLMGRWLCLELSCLLFILFILFVGQVLPEQKCSYQVVVPGTRTINKAPTLRRQKQYGVLISQFVLDVPYSVQFHHDIIFCLESDSIVMIVVFFSSCTGFLRVDILQFQFQHITCYFLSSCIHGILLFLQTTYERGMTSTRIQFVT